MLTRERLIAEITEQLPELSNELLAGVARKCWKFVDVQDDGFYIKETPVLVLGGQQYRYLQDCCRLSPVPVGTTDVLWTSQVRVDTPEGNTGRIAIDLIPPAPGKRGCKLRLTLFECDDTVLATKEADWQEELYQILVGDHLYELNILDSGPFHEDAE